MALLSAINEGALNAFPANTVLLTAVSGGITNIKSIRFTNISSSLQFLTLYVNRSGTPRILLNLEPILPGWILPWPPGKEEDLILEAQDTVEASCVNNNTISFVLSGIVVSK